MKCIYNCFKECIHSEIVDNDIFDTDICECNCEYYSELLKEEKEDNKRSNGAR